MTGFGRHRLIQFVVDAGIVALSWFLAFELRFDQGLPVYYDTLLRRTILLVVAIKLAVFLLFGFHRRWWRYVSVHDMWSAARGVVVASLVADVTVYLASPVHNVRLPRSIAVMDLLITLALVAGARLIARTVIERPRGGFVARGREVLVVGAGDAGRTVVEEMQRSRMLNYTPIGFVDDAVPRQTRILGVRVLGTVGELPRLVREYEPDEVLIAIPSASGETRRRVVEAAQAASVPVKTLPGLYELISGDVELAQIRPVQVEDVLGREPVEVDMRQIGLYLEGHTVLVTGAGGSIGSELCRQIARMGPARLILVDSAETPLFEIERELVYERDFTAAIPKLVDVKNRQALRREVFEKYKPTVVFHAAAYKHVPLMETHPLESVRNNVVATRIVAELAAESDVVERFVLISTDKAVNPKTVMGQSKALCEWIIESLGHRRDIKTRFVAVRFGNVLNSSGSVIPTFRKQIEKGGPVTVTTPEMTRFFMTIPEAVSLVVQAGAIGGRGQIFVLDMGEPVRILDLACNMIRLSGKQPRLPNEEGKGAGEIPIKFVGARPGEKLHEELWGENEAIGATEHPKILRLSRPPVDASWLTMQLAELEALADDGDTLEVVAKLGAIVRQPQREAVPSPPGTETSATRDEVGRPSGYGEPPWTPTGSSPA